MQDEPVGQREQKMFVPFFRPGYTVMYSTQHLYIFMRFFHTLYERMVKAQELIREKVIEDGQDEQKFTGLVFNLFLCGIASCLASTLDGNKFEDFERLIMGNKAYFLFTVDKLLQNTIKQLISIANEEQCQKGYLLYLEQQRTIEQQPEHWKGEKVYMDEFIRQMEDLGSGVFNKVVIRLLFSPESQVLAVHYVNLNPYNLEKKQLEKELQDVSFQRRRPEMVLQQVGLNINGQPLSNSQEACVTVRPMIFLKRNR